MTYRNEDVQKLVGQMVNVRVNGKADTALANQYGIAGYPTIILTNPDGSEIDRIYGYEPPDEFVKTIKDYLNDRNTLADYLRRADTAATMQLYTMIADKYAGRKIFTNAETYYRKVLQNDPLNKSGYADTALYNMGEMKIQAKQFTAAREIFDRLRKTYPESELLDDALFSKALALRRAEKYNEAIGEFKEFLKVCPTSDLVPDAEIYIAYCNELNSNKEEAIKLYQQFIEKHPKSPDAQWATGQIEKLKNPVNTEGSTE